MVSVPSCYIMFIFLIFSDNCNRDEWVVHTSLWKAIYKKTMLYAFDLLLFLCGNWTHCSYWLLHTTKLQSKQWILQLLWHGNDNVICLPIFSSGNDSCGTDILATTCSICPPSKISSALCNTVICFSKALVIRRIKSLFCCRS